MSHSPLSPNSTATGPDLPGGLTNEQLDRLAGMIADGRCDFPGDLPLPDTQRLHQHVRARLRGRLVHLIARAIADHLRRTKGTPREESDHA